MSISSISTTDNITSMVVVSCGGRLPHLHYLCWYWWHVCTRHTWPACLVTINILITSSCEQNTYYLLIYLHGEWMWILWIFWFIWKHVPQQGCVPQWHSDSAAAPIFGIRDDARNISFEFHFWNFISSLSSRGPRRHANCSPASNAAEKRKSLDM